MIRTIIDTKKLEVKEAYGNFLTCLDALNGKIITPRDEAYLRLQTKGKENIGRFGTWTSAGFEFVTGQLPILRLKSRLLDRELAREMVEANRCSRYFCTNTTKEYEESLEQAKKDESKKPSERNVIVLPSKTTFKIDNKNNRAVLETILKDQTKPYLKLNKSVFIYLINEGVNDYIRGTLLTQFWFDELDYFSGFKSYFGWRNPEYSGLTRSMSEKPKRGLLSWLF